MQIKGKQNTVSTRQIKSIKLNTKSLKNNLSCVHKLCQTFSPLLDLQDRCVTRVGE